MDAQANLSKVFTGLLTPNGVLGASAPSNPKSIGSAVQKFEAYFIQTMLKSMRSASLAKGLFESEKSNFYRDWHDQQLASDLSSKENFAIAKLLRQQFGGKAVRPTPSTSIASSHTFRRSPYASIGKSDAENKTNLKQSIIKEITKSIKKSAHENLSGPEKFINEMYPFAQRAASKLNTSADVLIAIAALETGWGVHTPKSRANGDSFNYFGIKANNWKGPKLINETKEFDGKKMIEVKDSFRMYRSPEESFNDFAKFLLSSPRYQNAVTAGRNPEVFIHELQKAGYATDPNYAEKVISILNGEFLRSNQNVKIKNQITAYSDSKNHLAEKSH